MKNLEILLSALSFMLASLIAQADPGLLESYNQAMFKFNDNVDQAAVKPIAKAYKAVMPSPLRSGVNNFFNNLRDAWTAINQFLQGKPDAGLSDAGRFAINSTFGIFGLFDVASADDIPKHNEDFGQTLGTWGVGEGSYFVIPLLGPSTIRDTAALFVDWEADPVSYLDDVSTRNPSMPYAPWTTAAPPSTPRIRSTKWQSTATRPTRTPGSHIGVTT